MVTRRSSLCTSRKLVKSVESIRTGVRDLCDEPNSFRENYVPWIPIEVRWLQSTCRIPLCSTRYYTSNLFGENHVHFSPILNKQKDDNNNGIMELLSVIRILINFRNLERNISLNSKYCSSCNIKETIHGSWTMSLILHPPRVICKQLTYLKKGILRT